MAWTQAQATQFAKDNGIDLSASGGIAQGGVVDRALAANPALAAKALAIQNQSASAAPAPASAPSAAPTAASAGYWNSDVATALAQASGIIPEGTVAKGGYLDAKLAELQKTDPAKVAEFNRIALGIQQGTMSPDLVMNYFIERETNKQKNDPEYGSLAKAPYKTFTPFSQPAPDFTPYGEKAPEFKPFALSDFIASPDYEFRKAEGQKAIDRAGSARGNFYSGGALKEAADFGSNLAASEYGDAYNRYNQDFQSKYGIFGDNYNRYNQDFGIKAGLYTDNYNRYNNDFGIGYNQAASDSDRLYNRYAGLAGAGSGTANSAVNNANNNAAQQGNILGQTANSQAAGAINYGNNLSQILANSFGNSSYKRKTP